MLSRIPISIDKVNDNDLNKEIVRVGMIAELDAINLYEQMASLTSNETLKKVLLDIADEEKTHLGEFLSILLELDKKQVEELEKGRKEVQELRGK